MVVLLLVSPNFHPNFLQTYDSTPAIQNTILMHCLQIARGALVGNLGDRGLRTLVVPVNNQRWVVVYAVVAPIRIGVATAIPFVFFRLALEAVVVQAQGLV